MSNKKNNKVDNNSSEEEREEEEQEEEIEEEEIDVEKWKEKAEEHEKKKEYKEAADQYAQLAEIYSQQLDQVEEAIPNCEKELSMRELAKESFATLSETRIKLSLFYQSVLNFQQSEEILQKVLEEAKKGNDSKIQAECLSELATLFLTKYTVDLEQKEAEEDEENEEENQVDEEELLKCVTHSITYGEEALKICYAKNTPNELLNSIVARSANHAMGEAYMHLGETNKAIPHFEQVLEITRKSNSEDLPEILLSCAKAYFGAAEQLSLEGNELDNEEEEVKLTEEQVAEKKQLQTKLVNQALALFKEIMESAEEDDFEGKSSSLAGFVSCYELIGDTQKMIDAQKQILEIDEQQEDTQSIIQSLAALADMLEEANKPEEAMSNYKRALELAEKEESDLVDVLKEKIDELQSSHKESLQPKKRKTKE